MPVYKCVLTRDFLVEIRANDAKEAGKYVEYFIGYFDESENADRLKYNFEILEMEMINNNTISTEKIQEVEE